MSVEGANHEPPAPISNTDGLPVDNPCLSFWQQTTRSFPYLLANAQRPLPPSTKYLIIGSGLSGALTAFDLIHSAGVPGSDVIILEAREAASGATSRNAGHVRPDAFRGFQVYQRAHGTTQALKIIANEKQVLEKIDAFVSKHNVPCDFNLATTLDVCLTPEFAEFNAQSFKAYQDAGGDLSHVKFYEGDDASRRTGIRQTVSAYEWPAGSSHPAKLAQWLLTESIAKGAMLFTHCPALNVSKSSTAEDRWDVETSNGIISAETVVHCTNGFAGHLIAQLKPYVTPTRAQALSFIPPAALSGERMLASTMSLRYSLHNFYSVMQRKADGIIILGASRKSPNLSQDIIDGMATPDDTAYNEEIKQDIIVNFENCFPVCEKRRLNHGEGAQHAWSGILGMTTDSVPFVGSLKGLSGQYVCAGFNGHGMARIFNCAPAVVKIIQGAKWCDTGLPECFDVTEERLQRLSQGSIESVW